jgi:ferrous iron transport protein A
LRAVVPVGGIVGSKLLETAVVFPLSELARGASAVVRAVRTGTSDAEGGDLGLRLLELGFVEGERVRVVAHGFPGRDPIAVRVGGTTFALRRFEAEHVVVSPDAEPGA